MKTQAQKAVTNMTDPLHPQSNQHYVYEEFDRFNNAARLNTRGSLAKKKDNVFA